MYAVLRAENPNIFLLHTAEIALTILCFMIGQQDL
jgi:hypothetical protein